MVVNRWVDGVIMIVVVKKKGIVIMSGTVGDSIDMKGGVGAAGLDQEVEVPHGSNYIHNFKCIENCYISVIKTVIFDMLFYV